MVVRYKIKRLEALKYKAFLNMTFSLVVRRSRVRFPSLAFKSVGVESYRIDLTLIFLSENGTGCFLNSSLATYPTLTRYSKCDKVMINYGIFLTEKE